MQCWPGSLSAHTRGQGWGEGVPALSLFALRSFFHPSLFCSLSKGVCIIRVGSDCHWVKIVRGEKRKSQDTTSFPRSTPNIYRVEGKKKGQVEAPIPYVLIKRAIKQANKLLNETHSLLLPHQLYLHINFEG